MKKPPVFFILLQMWREKFLKCVEIALLIDRETNAVPCIFDADQTFVLGSAGSVIFLAHGEGNEIVGITVNKKNRQVTDGHGSNR